MYCSSCTGVFHPATGHQWTEKTRICLSCAYNFIRWLKGIQHRKSGGAMLYEHTETSRNKEAPMEPNMQSQTSNSSESVM